MATGILEVLAGVRTPTEAATALGISVPRYYLLEQRALAGLISACEKRPIGRECSPQRRIDALEKENAKLRQDCIRQQALVRVAQRTIGLPTAPSKPVVKPGSNGNEKVKRKRRPMVRALKAMAALKEAPIHLHSYQLKKSPASCRPKGRQLTELWPQNRGRFSLSPRCFLQRLMRRQNFFSCRSC